MRIISTKIDGVFVIENDPIIDSRGAFTRLFCEKEFSSILGNRHIVQINHSITRGIGSIRGLHYQCPPFAEMKIICCLKGRVWDLALDLRQGSPTFLQWHAEELTPENAKVIVIPEGFAHGFQVMNENSELFYLHTSFYEKSVEKAVKYNDPTVSIQWPLAVTDISERDKNHPVINKHFIGIKL
ncbi:MAG: dTDP-4-dehydrorhamnose 3,5-epimerase [Candidatus Margulisbacteria bacterium GWF2_35_9]|nr:MAG: dTDP-4-dehydrorhamnose 3,5-epimerase [Candidatus Margulisbacteria bacterium GWF2_35_9]